MADAVFEGKEGRWITTKTGSHIFIPNDKSVKEVLEDRFEDYDWEDDPEDYPSGVSWRESERKKYYDFFVPEITNPTEKAHKEKIIKSFRGILDSSYAYIKQGFKNVLMKHHVNDMQLENIVADMMMAKQSVKYMWLQDIWVKDDTYYSRYKRKISMKYDGDYYSTLSNYYHESGHALDASGTNNYLSSTYKDNEFGKSISELLKEEVTEEKLDRIGAYADYLLEESNKAKQKYLAGDISRDEFRSWSRPRSQVKSSLADVIHASLGYDTAMSTLREPGHAKGYYYTSEYYDEGAIRRGSEFFAEMVDDLINNPNRTFSTIMEEIAPKACSVFYKILKEKYGYEKR